MGIADRYPSGSSSNRGARKDVGALVIPGDCVILL